MVQFGVAAGTLLGSLVSVALHFAITMRFTRQTLAISRLRLFLTGLLQPAAIIIPSVVLLPLWMPPAHLVLGPRLTVGWGLSYSLSSVVLWTIPKGTKRSDPSLKGSANITVGYEGVIGRML